MPYHRKRALSQVAKAAFAGYETRIPKALDLIGAGDAIPPSGLIIMKPNRTDSSPPPVTTDIRAVEAFYHCCRADRKMSV